MNKLHAYKTERPTDTVAANLIRSGLDPDLQIANPILALGLDAWRSLCGARPMPAPKDIDPLMLPRAILPHVLLLDIEQGPPARFRWRLIGTHITQTLGRDCSGCYWDDIYPPAIKAALTEAPQWAMDHCRPIRVTGTAQHAGKDFLAAESVNMPLSTDGRTVDRLFMVTVFSY